MMVTDGRKHQLSLGRAVLKALRLMVFSVQLDWGKAVFIVFIRHLWRSRCGIMGGVVHLSRYPLT